jgi:adenine-specific DNA methylase
MQSIVPNGWLAFELSVLRRLKFRSAAIAFAGEPDLGFYLKHWGVRVIFNDLARWATTKAKAHIENNVEQLTDTDVEIALEDAYVPRYKLQNPSLRRWFNETDAWWFDNVRQNVEKLESQTVRALALSTGMAVGDYVLSFDDATRELRQPLSQVFRRVWQAQSPPIDNKQPNESYNQDARRFIAEQQTTLLYLRLPRPRREGESRRNALTAWREEWLRGEDGFWDELESARAGRIGAFVATRQQYLHLVEDLLQTAAHLPIWAIAHADNGFISTNELVETINRVRKVETIYSKDFSELIGTRAAIITAIS